MFKLCSYIAFRIFLTKIWTVRKLMVDSEAEITELEIYTPISYMHTFCKRSESSKFKVRKKKCSIWGENDVCLENVYCHLILDLNSEMPKFLKEKDYSSWLEPSSKLKTDTLSTTRLASTWPAPVCDVMH